MLKPDHRSLHERESPALRWWRSSKRPAFWFPVSPFSQDQGAGSGNQDQDANPRARARRKRPRIIPLPGPFRRDRAAVAPASRMAAAARMARKSDKQATARPEAGSLWVTKTKRGKPEGAGIGNPGEFSTRRPGQRPGATARRAGAKRENGRGGRRRQPGSGRTRPVRQPKRLPEKSCCSSERNQCAKDGRRDEVGQDQPELERSQRNQPGYEAKVFSLMNASARLLTRRSPETDPPRIQEHRP